MSAEDYAGALMGDRTALPAPIDDIEHPKSSACYGGYTLAVFATSDGTVKALFRYAASGSGWDLVAVEGEMPCTSYGVPSDVAAHLPGCV